MNIDVVFQTWLRTEERLECFERSFSALCNRMCYDLNSIDMTYYSVSESKRIPDTIREKFESFCLTRNINIVWKESEPSLSSSLNLCQKTGDAPYILFLQDDWELQELLDIMPIVHHLESHNEDYVVRLIWRDQFEGFARQSDMPGLLYLDPTQHAYYFADNPHIRKREYIDILGEWEDSMIMGIDGKMFDYGRCENSQNNKSKKFADRCKVLVTDKKYFKHIGGNCTTLTEKKF